MSSTSIDQAFVNAFINGAFGLSIAHENSAYSPSNGTEYAELINIPNDITPLSLNDTDETDGLMRVILYYPVNKGSIAPKTKADEVLAVFSIGTKVCYEAQCATVTRVSRQKGIAVDGWYKIVLSIGYMAFIAR